jgi:hypothetical protein
MKVSESAPIIVVAGRIRVTRRAVVGRTRLTTMGVIEMSRQSRHSLRRDHGVDGTFALRLEPVTLNALGDADQQKRLIISAPTALEVARRDQDRDLSS